MDPVFAGLVAGLVVLGMVVIAIVAVVAMTRDDSKIARLAISVLAKFGLKLS